MSQSQENSPDSSRNKKLKFNKENISKTFKIFRFVWPYKTQFLLGILFLICSTTTNLIFPKLIGEIVSVIEGKSNYQLNQVVIFLIGILIVQSVFSFGRIYFFSLVSERSMAAIRHTVYQKIISLPVGFFEQTRIGELMSRITSDVQSLQDVLSYTLAELFRSIAVVSAGVVIIGLISWKLTVFMLATFPVVIVIAMFFGRHLRRLSKKAQDELARANVIVEETLQAVMVVKAFTNEPLESQRYGNALSKVIVAAIKVARFRGSFASFIIFALFGGIVGIVWFGATMVEKGEMPLSELMTFLFYTMFIGGSIGGLGDIYAQIQKTLGASERLLEILDEKSEVEISPQLAPVSIGGNITFENIQFSYPTRSDITVLKDISLEVAAGRKIALVGYSGAGKSTIVQLLMRYYHPQKGKILVDGQDIQSFEISAYRQNIAVVPQEVILFGGTIYENIAYGKPTATEAEIVSAARKANALDFIESFPEKFETVVGERGIKLSGGQRQRIAIARAILKDPKILILDEATSSLDAESEKLVQEALDSLMQNRTTIIIAHRLATVRNVDCIYVIKDGVILESGSHEQLTAYPNGLYASLIKLQFEMVD
ncbi:ABC transporter transmembrane domain-containing protein [Runella sp. MFBS21]|uniref:ABC transporter ATP-binding protein n=1 Tax=Runella sp. MFBS21 TaxID=3034018 RepID=UPI0023F8012F|nr:ABC transporter transmembrane domain-containing protein [Runella sp. MFBS21]MDF7817840.1 ABC transporter transmembrane domain-containing protein [Runella sp. MFBS21]